MRNKQINVKTRNGLKIITYEECSNCNGSGYSPEKPIVKEWYEQTIEELGRKQPVYKKSVCDVCNGVGLEIHIFDAEVSEHKSNILKRLVNHYHSLLNGRKEYEIKI